MARELLLLISAHFVHLLNTVHNVLASAASMSRDLLYVQNRKKRHTPCCFIKPRPTLLHIAMFWKHTERNSWKCM